VIEADVLQVDFARWRRRRPEAARRRQPAVQHLDADPVPPARAVDHVVDQHFMLQKEVVERMAAGPGTRTTAA
jgi:16S rRNA (adenine1518-N6/adenine1519-N6)-dimethyltransferase